MRIDFMEAVKGCKKDIDIEYYEKCDDCNGLGGHGEETCSECGGSGSVIRQTNTILGTIQTRTTCSECNGKGKTYKTKCSSCKGTGKTKVRKTITIDIPAGIEAGEQLRVPGKGEVGSNGGPNGDLYIEIRISEHELYKRKGNDIYIELPVSITDLCLGCKRLKAISPDNIPADVFQAMGQTMLIAVGGASGAFFGSMFIAAADAVKGRKTISVEDFADMWKEALLTAKKKGGAQPGDKTLVDALDPAVTYLKECGDIPFSKAAVRCCVR